MENFEMIEGYVSGKLNAAEKQAFEQKLQADPSLQNDVALQKQIIEGVKKARMTELKAMLNQVPVGGLMQAGASAGQIAAGVITAGVIITGTLFYFKPWKKPVSNEIKTEKPISEKIIEKPTVAVTKIEGNEKKEAASVSEPAKEKKKVVTTIKPKQQPKIDVMDPTEELTQEEPTDVRTSKSQPAVVASRVAVETNDTNKKYFFHYQFSQNKLILYGTFDKGLYEILEVTGSTHSLFLFYKENYYLLNEKQTNIAPLQLIRDAQLIRKLREFRSH